MFSRCSRPLLSVCLFVLSALTAHAQDAPPPKDLGSLLGSSGTSVGGFSSSQWRMERVATDHWRMIGQVEIERDGLKFSADEIDLYTDTNKVVATGNVVFSNKDGRISAERVEFDTKALVGRFVNASGIFTLGPKTDRTLFGGQDPDVYFYGELIEKVGDQEYRLTRGAFTTCVQPTPRWELTSGTVTIKVDDHALLRDTVFRVKGVPLLYLPIAYYPLKKEQRNTGFLLPTYGSSTLRGRAISNAFFWAIGRSHDATFFHDWFTRTGQGEGAEYRYIAGPGSEGNFRTYFFNQKTAEFSTNGVTSTLPASHSFELTGTAAQTLPGGLRARARFDYFSNLTTQQLYQSNVYDASRRLRTLGGSVNGNWGPYSLSSVYQRNEAFEGDTSSIVYGSTPRITGAISPRRLFGMPLYAGVSGEFANLLFRDQRGTKPIDTGMTRLDVSPTLRVPFSKLTFLTVNSSAAYRLTRYSESLDPVTSRQVAEPLTRAYLSLRSDVIGPVFTRIFNTPTNPIGERFKHVIEPTFGFEQTTSMDNYKQVVVLTDNSDFVVGGLTRFTYGLTNRLIARTRGVGGQPGRTREFLTATVQQSYYSTPEASQYDITYASANRGSLSSVSPLALTLRTAPTQTTDATVRVEQSTTGAGMQVLSLSSSARFGAHSVSTSWSRRRLIQTSPADNYLTANTGLRFLQNRVGGDYALSWDIGRSTVVSQRGRFTYNAQCCGLTLEYQAFSYPQVTSRFPLPSDRRIHFSVMLAGLGTSQGLFGGQR